MQRGNPNHTRLMPSTDARRALAGLDTDVRDRLRTHVIAMRTADNGWATSVGRESDVESTSWVLTGAALLPVLAPLRGAAREWLRQHQQANGSFTFRQGLEIATWPTFPALLALTIAGGSSDAQQRATSWLAHEHSVTPGWWQRVLGRFSSPAQQVAEPAVVLDATLDGYGWAHQTFAWVEPTSMAMIALAAQSPTPAIRTRVAIGARLLIDRQSSDGGWNYGNKRVLGVNLPGYPDTTGWALLGLAAAVRSGSIIPSESSAAVARGFASLRTPESTYVSPLPLALELLAYSAHHPRDVSQRARATAPLHTAIVAAFDGVRDGYPLLDTRTAVLALLALHDIDLIAARVK